VTADQAKNMCDALWAIAWALWLMLLFKNMGGRERGK